MVDDARNAAPGHVGPERRQNLLFRKLIDEMIEQVRELRAHAGPWPTDERERAEEHLERIMSQVRAEAFRNAK